MITQQEYQTRREKLAQQLPNDSIAILPSAQEQFRNGDAHYRFRQDSNFYYLTGFNEPEAVLVIIKRKNDVQSILFNRPRDAAQEQWTGRRLGQEDAGTELGIEKAFPIETFGCQLLAILANKTAVYYPMSRHSCFEKTFFSTLEQIKSQIRTGVKAPQTLCDIDPLIAEMRLFKSEGEIALMRKAADISAEAHKNAMKACKNCDFEYQLEAELLYEFSKQGCRAVAYDPIVGSGENTCILHYTTNNRPLKSGDMLLIDAGGEFENYAADITRSFPVNGHFNPEQKAIYELVLKAQKAAIRLIKPGLAWNLMQQEIVQILTAGLCELGLLEGPLEKIIADGAYKRYYMHNSGHWLGLDVHDAGQYKINNQWRPLEPGMVLTVEPGLYIQEDPSIDSKWWNIGVRIEDDVLVTKDGYDILSKNLPVEVTEIEALLRG